MAEIDSVSDPVLDKHALRVATNQMNGRSTQLIGQIESAVKTGIRSYLLKGDRASALKAFRTYEAALHKAHGLEPSLDVKKLLSLAPIRPS